ncbi:MAG: LacI family transcriptional regulator, partial [Clostridiaceae bacterium]|nr:LacI family transcriptional regulator [Clostridiaceae bacterium]
VLADRLVENFQSDAVLVDNINGTYSAIEHLINMGYRRIGFISGDLKLTSAIERYEGYKRALKDYCIPYDSNIVKFGDFHVKCGYDLMKELYEAQNTPPAVFISNYFMHIGATRYLLEMNMSRKHLIQDNNNACNIANTLVYSIKYKESIRENSNKNTRQNGEGEDEINNQNCNEANNDDYGENYVGENYIKDIMIASFDDMELSSLLGFCKLRVAQPVTEIGRQAARLLLSRVEQKRKEKNDVPNDELDVETIIGINAEPGRKSIRVNNLDLRLAKQKIIRLKTSLVFS